MFVEFDGLAIRFGRVVPDIAALLELAGRIVDETIGRDLKLEIALARVGTSDRVALASEVQACGLADAIATSGIALIAVASASDLVDPDPATAVMMLAGRAATAAASLAPGIPTWLTSDRPPADHRSLQLTEAPRVIREAARLAVPRTMPDSLHRGSVIALPIAGPGSARELGFQALRTDLRADWVVLGETQLFHSWDAILIEELIERGGRVLTDGAAREELALAPPGCGPNAGTVLIESNGYAFGLLTGAGTWPWQAVRRARFGASKVSRRRGAAQLAQPDQYGAAMNEDTSFMLGYANQDNDGVIVVQIDPGAVLPGSVASLARGLQQRFGGAAVLVAPGDCEDPPQALVDASELIWQAERNSLFAAVRIVAGSGSIRTTIEPSPPPIAVLSVPAQGFASNDELAEAIACALEEAE